MPRLPGPFAHSSLHPPCSIPSFHGHSLVLVLPLVVIHHSEGLTTLNSCQPCQLQVFSHHWSFGRLFFRAPLPSTPIPLDILPPFFLLSVLLGDALQTIYVCNLLACYRTLFQHNLAFSNEYLNVLYTNRLPVFIEELLSLPQHQRKVSGKHQSTLGDSERQ